MATFSCRARIWVNGLPRDSIAVRRKLAGQDWSRDELVRFMDCLGSFVHAETPDALVEKHFYRVDAPEGSETFIVAVAIGVDGETKRQAGVLTAPFAVSAQTVQLAYEQIKLLRRDEIVCLDATPHPQSEIEANFRAHLGVDQPASAFYRKSGDWYYYVLCISCNAPIVLAPDLSYGRVPWSEGDVPPPVHCEECGKAHKYKTSQVRQTRQD